MVAPRTDTRVQRLLLGVLLLLCGAPGALAAVQPKSGINAVDAVLNGWSQLVGAKEMTGPRKMLLIRLMLFIVVALVVYYGGYNAFMKGKSGPDRRIAKMLSLGLALVAGFATALFTTQKALDGQWRLITTLLAIIITLGVPAWIIWVTFKEERGGGG